MTKPIDLFIDKEAVWTNESSGPPAGWDGVMPYAVREGVLKILGMEINCAVLNDGRRVVSGPDIEQLLKIFSGDMDDGGRV